MGRRRRDERRAKSNRTISFRGDVMKAFCREEGSNGLAAGPKMFMTPVLRCSRLLV